MGTVREPQESAQPPHTLAWTAAALHRAGWQVAAVDAVASRLTEAQALSAIVDHRPAIVILLTSPATADADSAFIRALRLHLTTFSILLVSLAARHLPPTLVREANMVLAGEPEGAVDVACRSLLGHKSRVGLVSPQALGVPGYDAQGHLLDLDSLPFPDWDLFPLRQYDYLPIVSSRGCGRGCRYCTVPVTQGIVGRARVAEQVVEEMRLLNSCYRVQRFRFLDPLWGADAFHAEALCDALIQSRLSRRVTWTCESRADLLDLHLLDRMAKAGCRELHLGLESVSPETLVTLGRIPLVEDMPEYLRRTGQMIRGCHTLGIACHVHVMAGLPGDESGFRDTRAFLLAYSPDAVHVTPVMPYPGTSIIPTSRIDAETSELEGVANPDAPPARVSPWRRVVGRLDSLPSA